VGWRTIETLYLFAAFKQITALPLPQVFGAGCSFIRLPAMPLAMVLYGSHAIDWLESDCPAFA